MDLWPLFDLKVTTCDPRFGEVELRYPEDGHLEALAELAREPIHDEATMPFSQPWTDEPPEKRARSVLQWNWRTRAEWLPERWHMGLAMLCDGRVVGTQGIHAEDFAVTRTVETGSWLGRMYQGQGIGTVMRRLVLHLAFAGLGADWARSGAFTDNPASRRVTEKLGYSEDGTEVLKRRGERAVITRYVLSRAEWEATVRPEVEISGLEPCLEMFGLQ